MFSTLLLTLGLLAFAIALVITPFVRDLMVRFNLVDNPDAIRKFHPAPIPRAGGIVIAISYVASFLFVFALPLGSSDALQVILPHFWTVLPAAELIFITGLLDDIVSLRPWQKLIGQVLAAAIAYAGGVQIQVLGPYSLDPWLAFVLTIVWLIACTNAFNLIDGMDGLATGVGLFASMTVLIAALTHSSFELALVTVPLIGCLIGFLRYNFNPASVFLGDSGSLLIGFLLGCFGALWAHKSATMLGMTAPLIAVSIPLLDAVLAVVRRFLRNQPIFGGDRGHIHHRLLDRGLTTRRTALLIYGLCGLAAAFSLLVNTLEHRVGGLVVVLFCVAAWIGVQHLGYIEFGVARQMFAKGTFRRMIDVQTRMAVLESSLRGAGSLDELWENLCGAASDFGFHAVELEVCGLHFANKPDDELAREWHIDVPLGKGHLRFRRSLSADPDMLPIGAFVEIVVSSVEQQLDRQSMLKKPAASAAHVTAGGL